MNIYCLKCKKKTGTGNVQDKTKNGMRFAVGPCITCGTNKSVILGKVRGGGDDMLVNFTKPMPRAGLAGKQHKLGKQILP